MVGPSFPVTAIGLRAQPVSNRKSSNATQATRVMVIMPSFQQLEQPGEIDRLVDEPEESGELLHKRSQFFGFLIAALTFFVAFSHLGDLVLRPGRRRGSRREAHESHASKALLAPPDTTSSGSVRLNDRGAGCVSRETGLLGFGTKQQQSCTKVRVCFRCVVVVTFYPGLKVTNRIQP